MRAEKSYVLYPTDTECGDNGEVLEHLTCLVPMNRDLTNNDKREFTTGRKLWIVRSTGALRLRNLSEGD